MDIVLVGLPGSGKSAVGRRLAHRHGATFIDLDERIETEAGRTIPEIFADEGEAAFRTMERRAVADLGPADPDPAIARIIASGGGAVVDPRNRWALYRDRVAIWLDGRPEVLAQRLRRSPRVRPLVAGGDPIGAVRDLAIKRERFYAAAAIRIAGVAEVPDVIRTIEDRLAEDRSAVRHDAAASRDRRSGASSSATASRPPRSRPRWSGSRHDARSSCPSPAPGTPSGSGSRPGCGLPAGPSRPSCCPQGEDAKRLSVVEGTARDLVRLRVERSEPLVAIGGGALGDAAGFVAATYLRGVPLIHVPTTLVAQIDSSIGGKTGVDLAEGKNLVGAFHLPEATIIDTAALRTLPERQRRAALGEAVKMAALGDERLFELLETDGAEIAAGSSEVDGAGAIAEVVERCAWAKVEVVLADQREHDPTGGRITLNLGHSVGHALEATAGYSELLHGEAVAYGLRAACSIGQAVGVTPASRADRITHLLDRLGLATEPVPYSLDTVLGHLASDKKHAAGALRWVLPTEDGVLVRSGVEAAVVERAVLPLLAVAAAR